MGQWNKMSYFSEHTINESDVIYFVCDLCGYTIGISFTPCAEESSKLHVKREIEKHLVTHHGETNL